MQYTYKLDLTEAEVITLENALELYIDFAGSKSEPPYVTKRKVAKEIKNKLNRADELQLNL